MGLIDRIKGLLRRDVSSGNAVLRNRAGGMAWINGRARNYPGAEILIGRAVKTVALKLPRMWSIDPPQQFVTTGPIRVNDGRIVPAGSSVLVIAIADEALDPWQEDVGGVSEAEVLQLYSPNKERAPA